MPNQLQNQNTNTDTASLVDTDSKLNKELQQENQVVIKRKSGTINWKLWQSYACVKLWEAVALSLNIFPSKLEKTKETNHTRYLNYRRRLKRAITWLSIDINFLKDHPANGIDPKDKMVFLVDFVRWAQANNLKITPELMEITKEPIQQTKIQNDMAKHKSGDAKKRTANRDEKIINEATKIGLELQAKNKEKNITKVMVAKQLLKAIVAKELSVDMSDCKGMSEARIIRILLKKW